MFSKSKRKAKKENKERRTSIRDYSTGDPSLESYGTIKPTYGQTYASQTPGQTPDENLYQEIDDVISITGTVSSRCSDNSDVTNADSGIVDEDYIVPRLPKAKLSHEQVRKQLKHEKKKKGGCATMLLFDLLFSHSKSEHQFMITKSFFTEFTYFTVLRISME